MKTGYCETRCVEESDHGGGIWKCSVRPVMCSPELQLSFSISSNALHTLTVHPFSIRELLDRAIFSAYPETCSQSRTLT